ncbi:transcriptional regulator [Phocicoccus schoeneichii]|uniref:Transcriptional repressor SdpR n=1 Tax=Phocicoccus schoeneichii TaxID=1812261 RepID=A0A6V7RQ67_9BACL|nr:metalloregulator ArsR/SmtB family transcription factor [Jeotgalicoccus schoeneichii]GGH55024.1 transcriptional regulator [Jeotgalicoccus schoeneichii]CAD2079994.1 Transcriptional repressor SdpR [Jeotgalicoccus schoeneichii]
MNYQELSSTIKTMADPSRLEILDILSCGELCACDLLEHFPFSQPTLSHHMKSLVQNQLVTSRKEGTKTMYQLNQDLITEVTSQLSLLGSNHTPCICENIRNGECDS